MKLLLLLSLISLNAFAVQTRDCPKQIKLEYSNLKATMTFDQLTKSDNFEPEQIASMKVAWSSLGKIARIQKVMTMKAAANGRCVYVSGAKNEQIEMYSRAGKDILLYQSLIGQKGIRLRVYSSITALSPEAVTLAPVSGLALAIPRYPYEDYNAGGPLVFVGNVLTAKISAK